MVAASVRRHASLPARLPAQLEIRAARRRSSQNGERFLTGKSILNGEKYSIGKVQDQDKQRILSLLELLCIETVRGPMV